MSTSSASIVGREIIQMRLLNAPRALVWQAWSDPKHLIHWWGPDGFTNTFHEFDMRPSGIWRFIMHGPDGTDYENWIQFHEVVEPEKLVFSHGASADDPQMFQTTVTFEVVEGNKTQLTMRALFTSEEVEMAKFGAIEGGQQTLARLDAHLQKM